MAAIADKIWADARGTWVEADPDEQQRMSEIEYVRSDIYRVALMKIKCALDAASDKTAAELWISDEETLGAYVDKMLARIDAT